MTTGLDFSQNVARAPDRCKWNDRVSGSLRPGSGQGGSRWHGPREGRRRKAWEQVRRRVLIRDNEICQMGLEGCTSRATTVDHIRPLAEGGAELDMKNLRAACWRCNTLAGARLGAQRLQMKSQKWSRAW